MKHAFLRPLLVLAVLTLFLGCSSDSDSDPVECPQGYTGAACDIQLMPTLMKVTKIRVTQFPNMNGSSFWDPINPAPDIFVRFGYGDGTDAGTTTLFTSDYYPDAVSDGTNYDFVPSAPIVISPLNQHVILLGDYDSVSANELMAGFTFMPYSDTNDFPSTIVVADNTLPVRFEFFVTYQWD